MTISIAAAVIALATSTGVGGAGADSLMGTGVSRALAIARAAQIRDTRYELMLNLTERDIGFVVDDNPLKHGRHVPGTGIPILPVEDLYRAKPHVVVVTGWNFADSIRALHPNVPWDWVVPLPEVRTYPGSVQ